MLSPFLYLIFHIRPFLSQYPRSQLTDHIKCPGVVKFPGSLSSPVSPYKRSTTGHVGPVALSKSLVVTLHSSPCAPVAVPRGVLQTSIFARSTRSQTFHARELIPQCLYRPALHCAYHQAPCFPHSTLSLFKRYLSSPCPFPSLPLLRASCTHHVSSHGNHSPCVPRAPGMPQHTVFLPPPSFSFSSRLPNSHRSSTPPPSFPTLRRAVRYLVVLMSTSLKKPSRYTIRISDAPHCRLKIPFRIPISIQSPVHTCFPRFFYRAKKSSVFTLTYLFIYHLCCHNLAPHCPNPVHQPNHPPRHPYPISLIHSTSHLPASSKHRVLLCLPSLTSRVIPFYHRFHTSSSLRLCAFARDFLLHLTGIM
ncbi:hypothetical protein TRVL_05801 [Trypanosoma vivax]|nr:hypothetical protein TRVL_05801 [Trypanosoma vivax]